MSDWREVIRKNSRRTRWVITAFVVLYLSLGLIIDVVLQNQFYQATPSQILHALVTLQIMPYATLTMAVVASIALLVTYSMYDKIVMLGTDYHEVTSDTREPLLERQLYNVVEEMKVAAGLRYMPKIYIIEADYMNAFASGYSEKSAMVAITRGLLNKLDRAETQAVMAHELSHIRHLDIKVTLTVAVLSNIMLIALDFLFYNIVFGRRGRMDQRLVLIIVILRYVIPLVTVLLTFAISRAREYMADAGSVELMRDNEPMARALIKIHEDHQMNAKTYRQQYGDTAHEEVRRAAYLYDPVKAGIEPIKAVSSLFSTHPTLEQRLKAIGYKRKKSSNS